jgi:hypothetical protein
MRSRSLLALVAAPIAAVAYFRYLRPWQLSWGATPEEVSRDLPGDELVPEPTFNATRAISIAAPAEEIWPWLVQVGVARAGWYSYDILDNLGHRSARHIIPELQNLAVGDVIPMSPDGKQGIRVHSVNPPHSMIWGTPGGHDLGLAARRPPRWVNPTDRAGALAIPLAVTVNHVLGTRRAR